MRWLGVLVCLLGGMRSAEAQDLPRRNDSSGTQDLVRFEDGHTGEIVEIPRSWLDSDAWQVPIPEVHEPVVRRAADSLEVVQTPEPQRWARPERPNCERYHGARVCDGPLHVPAASPAATRRIRRLGLAPATTAQRLLMSGPTRPWVLEAQESAVTRHPRTIRFPVERGRIGRGVGMVNRIHGRGQRFHKGVDIGAGVGDLVLAANDGLVVYANNGVHGYGNLIMIVHADASVTFYAHLSEARVSAGTLVVRGQVIGEVGTTGLSVGPHLHFEWRIDGTPNDPTSRFRAPPGTMGLAQPPSASARAQRRSSH